MWRWNNHIIFFKLCLFNSHRVVFMCWLWWIGTRLAFLFSLLALPIAWLSAMFMVRIKIKIRKDYIRTKLHPKQNMKNNVSWLVFQIRENVRYEQQILGKVCNFRYLILGKYAAWREIIALVRGICYSEGTLKYK